jgi:hypothetical protein
MAFLRAVGWQQNVFLVAILGVAKVMTLCLKNNDCLFSHRPSLKDFTGYNSYDKLR